MVLLIMLFHFSLVPSEWWVAHPGLISHLHNTLWWSSIPRLTMLQLQASEVTTQEQCCNFYTKGFNQIIRSSVIIFSSHLSMCVCVWKYVSLLNSFNLFRHVHHLCFINCYFLNSLITKFGCVGVCIWYMKEDLTKLTLLWLFHC